MQSLLGGFALIHLYMTYLLELQSLPTGGSNSGFLHFYSPIAINMQRTYYILITVSLLSAADKYTRDKLVSCSLCMRRASGSFQDVMGCVSVVILERGLTSILPRSLAICIVER